MGGAARDEPAAGVDRGRDDGGGARSGVGAAPRRRTVPRHPVSPIGPASLAPPIELGRNLVVTPGADVPPAWERASRHRVDAATLSDPATLLARLHAGAHDRASLVIELDPAAALALEHPARGSDTESRPPHEIGPRFEFVDEAVRHLVWSNAVDLRDPDRPRWSAVDAAVAAGCRVPSGAVDGDVDADVVLTDGTAVWIDGGPVRITAAVAGTSVVHTSVFDHPDPRVPSTDLDAHVDAVLAPDQFAAVTHPGGSARIVAPAGSGKTRVLTERARHLIERWRVPAASVTLVAFNKRAQEEMRDRTADLPGLEVRTLNSIALAILNGTPPFARRDRRVTTIDEVGVRRILSTLVNFPRRRNTDPAAPWIDALSQIRLGLVPPEVVEQRFDGDVDGLTQVWPRYRAQLEREGVVDFDGQIHGALELLLTDVTARQTAQRAGRLLLVDEFQDLTPAHVLLVRLMSGPAGSVFGVGDDDQTIYGYQGADPAWLIEFDQLFPGSGDHPLEVNYRCPPDVVEVVDRLLRHNRRRVPKVIRSGRPVAPDGPERPERPERPEGPGGPVAPGSGAVDGPGWSVVTSEDPVADTVAAVRDAIDVGRPPREVVVLARVNAALAPVQVALTVAGIGVRGGVGVEFLERTAVRSVLAWLRLASGPFRADDLREAIRRPSRPLSPRVTEWVLEQRDVGGLLALSGRLRDDKEQTRVADFARDIDGVRSLVAAGTTTRRVVDVLIDEVGLGGSVATLDATRRGMNRAAQGDDLAAVRDLASLCADPSTFERWMREQLSTRHDPAGVLLSTVHRVKGQEWPIVVVHLADAEQYPHRLSDDVEEERRLFHVALTRAGHHVRVVTGPRPSPFVDELTTEPPPPGAEDPEPRGRDRRDERAGATASTSRSGSRRGGAAEDDPLLDRSTVPVVVGTVLVDQGREWTVVDVVDGGVMARAGGADRRFHAGSRVETAGRRRGGLAVGHGIDPASVRAFDGLRSYRDRVRDGKPAYTVFDDRTLAAIAHAAPADLAELARVRGVGPVKLEQYGDDVLTIVESARTTAP